MNFPHWGFWGWFGIVVAVLVVLVIAMNLKDIYRYVKIRAM